MVQVFDYIQRKKDRKKKKKKQEQEPVWSKEKKKWTKLYSTSILWLFVYYMHVLIIF